MLGVAAVALFLSTLTTSSIGAALGTVGVLIVDCPAGSDAATALHPYLPTRYWLAFVDLFRDPILWRDAARPGFSSAICSSSPWRPGRASAPRTSPTSSEHAVGECGGSPSTEPRCGQHDRVTRKITMGSSGGLTDVLNPDVDSSSRAADSMRDHLIRCRPDGRPKRSVGSFVTGVESPQHITVGHQLFTRGRATARELGAERGLVVSVVR